MKILINFIIICTIIYVLGATMSSSKVVTESLSHNTLIDIKLEPADSQDSIENLSEKTEAISGISELTHNVDNSCKTKNGKFLLD